MSLLNIERFRIPALIVQETDKALRQAGQQGYEFFVLWSGVVQGRAFVVQACHIPKQTGYKLPSGLCVRVEGDELHRLNRWLFENNQTLGVQVHSHPTAAYHSETDNTFPIVTVLGGLSIVVPDFARHGLRGRGVAIYRLRSQGWEEISSSLARILLDFGA